MTPGRTGIAAILGIGAVAVAGCATSAPRPRPDLQLEFAEVARNCEVPEALLGRISTDGRRARLLLPAQVHRARGAAPARGRIACIEHWARERGLGLAVVAAPAPALRETALDRIAERCGLPRTSLRLSDRHVSFTPTPDARYGSVICALRRLERSGPLEGLPVAFIPGSADVR